MKKFIGFLLVSAVIIGCGKVEEYSHDFGSVAVINASPGSPSMLLFVDTFRKTPSAIAYRGSSGYISVAPGTRNIELRSSVDLVTDFVSAGSETFTANTASTYIVYDTQTVASKVLKTIRLSDDLTPPAAGIVKFRFLNLGVNSVPLDVTFLRTSVTPNDSVTITNQAYIGGNPNAEALSPFSYTMPTGAYTIKLKNAGTQTIRTSATLSAASTNHPYGSIYTFYATGTAAGQGYGIGAFRHYP